MMDDCFVLFTVDVEDWFQVENFKPWIPFSSWPDCELRVERNTNRILDLLDSQRRIRKQSPWGGKGLQATFFVLAWVAERFPRLIREIHDRGHEIASHGFYHNLCAQQALGELKRDLTDSKKLLEDILGRAVWGYRAPCFSIDNEILKVIEDSGYRYDSSFNSFGMHDRYGRADLSQCEKKGIAFKISDRLFEIPISNWRLGRHVFPLGGGGYFRLFPFSLFRRGVRAVLKKEKAYVFYMHPWEIDPDQPRVHEASLGFKYRHYVNLKTCDSKLSSLLTAFRNVPFITCRGYLELVAGAQEAGSCPSGRTGKRNP